MSNPKGTRRAVAEIRWDSDPGAILWVGNRPVAACWPLISAYFRDLLLPPHRRAEDESVTWIWNEPVNPPALTSAEINAVRRHLQSELQLFVENVAGGVRAQGQRGDSNPVDTVQLGVTLREWVQQVTARPDAEFARYLCRTDQGLRLHSWGAPQPSDVRLADAKGLELAGHVLVGGMPALHDVLLESGDGEMLAETPSDSLGAFRFSKLTPGKYRLRARSKRGTFPPHGVVVVLTQTSVVDVVLADDGPAAAPSRGRRPARAGQPQGLAIAVVVAVLVGSVGWWAFNRNSGPNTSPVVAAETKASTPAAPHAQGVNGGGVARSSTSLVESNRPATPSTVTSRGAARPDAAITSDLAQAHESSRAAQRKETSASVGAAAGGPVGGGAPLASAAGGASAASSGSTAAATITATPSIAAGTTASATVQRSTSSPPPTSPQAGASTAAGAVAVATSAHAQGNPTPSEKSAPPPPAIPLGKRAPEIPTDVPNALAAAGVATAAAATTLERLPEVTTEAPRTEAGSSTTAATARPSLAGSDALGAPPPVAATASLELSPDSPTPSATAPTSRETRGNAFSSAASTAVWRASASRLTRTVRVRLAPWRVRLLEDSILPTQPLRAGQVEPVAALRQRILEEQKAKLPATLAQGEVLSGLRVEVAATDLTDGLAWRDDQGAVIPGSLVEKGRAEITWTAANAPKDRPIRLSGSNGVVLVEARYEAQTRELVVRTAEEVQAWLRWVVRAVPSDVRRELTEHAAGGKPRFVWRTGTGNPVQPGWHATNSTDAAADHRVDLPLGSVFGAVAAQSCALLDQASGWALVTETRQAADRPLGL